MNPLTQSHPFLKDSECSNPECDGSEHILYLHGKCHMKAKTWSAYDKRTGILTVECAECGKPIASFQVAP